MYRTFKKRSHNTIFEEFQQHWNSIPQELCIKLVTSMKNRLQAVINAKGGFTKYSGKSFSDIIFSNLQCTVFFEPYCMSFYLDDNQKR